MVEDQHVIDLLPSYALGCLRGDEERQVAEHVAHCLLCQEEYRAYQAVVNQLPLAAPINTPPRELKSTILDQVKRQTSLPPRTKASSRLSLGSIFQRFAPAWGVVSLVLILMLGISNLLLWQAVQRSAQPSRDDFMVVTLGGDNLAPEAKGWLVISPDGRYGTLIVDGLPRLSPEQQFQLWLIDGEERTNGGVFSVGESGYGSLKVWSQEPLISYSRVGITIEPAGGSPGPTGERVMAGEL